MFLFHQARSLHELTHKLEVLISSRLWLQVIIGFVTGASVGFLLSPDYALVTPETANRITVWLALPGQWFFRLIQMVLIPLVVASIIRGIGGSSNPERLRRVGLRFTLFVVVTSAIAALVGIALALALRPGDYLQLQPSLALETNVAAQVGATQTLPEFFAELIPANPLVSAIEGELLGVVIFAVIFGIALSLQSPLHAGPILAFTDGILDVCMTIVKWAMLLSPWAVFGLMARTAAEIGIVTLFGMGVYIGAVMSGFLIMLVFYYFLAWALGGRGIVEFARAVGGVQLLAFSTSSSAAVMPLSTLTAEQKLNVDHSISEIVIPLGATIHMAGTALFQSVAILFFAQMADISLGINQILLIVFTTLASSLGSPAAPGASTIIMLAVITRFGIPATGLVLIMGVNQLLGMFLTTLNVTGDLVACVILDRFKK